MKTIAYNPFFATRWPKWSNDNDLNPPVSVNVVEKENGFYLDLISPGLDKSDFKMELNNNTLTISAEKKKETTSTQPEKVLRKEFEYHTFSRSFYLPQSVEGDAIEATYEQGILKIFIPKKATAVSTVKQIEIS